MRQITLCVPIGMTDAANQMMRAVGYGPDDDRTFTGATHTDSEGAEYAVAAGKLHADHIAAISPWTAVEPPWGADMTLAAQAASILSLAPTGASEGQDEPLPPVDLSKPVLILDEDPATAIASLGLSRILPPAPEVEEALPFEE